MYKKVSDIVFSNQQAEKLIALVKTLNTGSQVAAAMQFAFSLPEGTDKEAIGNAIANQALALDPKEPTWREAVETMIRGAQGEEDDRFPPLRKR
ncbi:hypothetical protein C5B42_02710 [Candidatus Cerribacteria bacterium 'Amazon FNV 2010 28 9']|uniref:Uncharacterized protein n=1 Tax=Candidatus Cerribacteria bacterium 'Amazon FNV 2010 28 9' TaxID=2081795 RepID=A0A317JPE9_9BACT|nr:MAG: hypothetical protein C5B42_02710 [Candidatus Cerribacteria bacterium 'Amazon FNV 2010 28 9']